MFILSVSSLTSPHWHSITITLIEFQMDCAGTFQCHLSHHFWNNGCFPSIISILSKCWVVNLKGKISVFPQPCLVPIRRHFFSLFIYINNIYIYICIFNTENLLLYRQFQKSNCRFSINFQHDVLWIMIILKCPTVLMHKNCFPNKRNNQQDCHFFPH